MLCFPGLHLTRLDVPVVQAYGAVFHMATMAAGVELATAMGDASTASSCSTALAAAKKSFDLLQWNTTKNGYDAGSKVGKWSGSWVDDAMETARALLEMPPRAARTSTHEAEQ